MRFWVTFDGVHLHCLAEKYLQEAWPIVKSALKEYGISCELNLVCVNNCCLFKLMYDLKYLINCCIYNVVRLRVP